MIGSFWFGWVSVEARKGMLALSGHPSPQVARYDRFATAIDGASVTVPDSRGHSRFANHQRYRLPRGTADRAFGCPARTSINKMKRIRAGAGAL
jgi:hypothetical protein